jgi:hypothetical protein
MRRSAWRFALTWTLAVAALALRKNQTELGSPKLPIQTISQSLGKQLPLTAESQFHG